MKIIVIGGTGTIGRKVVERLSSTHELIIAGRRTGDMNVDIADAESIKRIYENAGQVDAVICTAGEVSWGKLHDLSEEEHYKGIRNKLMGQINLVRIGMDFLPPGGSFTLTSGILAEDPVVGTSSAAMVNGALHGFVKAAAQELGKDRRINVVAPGLVEDSYKQLGEMFPGRNPVPMMRVVSAYIRSVEGKGNGEIIRVYV